MPRGTVLTQEEKSKIEAYSDAGFSQRQIAQKIQRSQTVVRNFLLLGQNYGKNATHDRNKKLNDHQKRLIFRTVRKQDVFASQIVKELNLPVTTRRVQQILRADNNLVYKKYCTKPCLTKQHKQARLNFAKKYMSWTTEWSRVVFSDEKKFNLDGPDGFKYHWHDKRLQETVKMSRVSGGGSVMVWAGFCSTGTTKLAFIPGRMDSKLYTELLDEILIERAEELCGENFIFQQDNAAIHTARLVRDFFAGKNITVLDWPARSPNLNPIENLWGILARRIYNGGQQYKSVKDLKMVVDNAWTSITVEELKVLVDSMPKRIFEVITNKGGYTKY